MRQWLPLASDDRRCCCQVCVLADNTRMLGFYSPANGMTIHIVDHVR